ncbi:hypothetical protein [Desulfopila sp. IMCC35008]|uniref:hypothetical protein n=1 Tax=Desulfopila sp. IMCC35008 TaxID=2653858 RepID=UPI0013CFC3B0|nr:hypothetical protein [Desulfopila sp. IMCC35008]
MEDITDFLAFEVKKEMADRYFGFRKQIETDTAAYIDKVARTTFELENNIGLGLTRIYILLHQKSLITSFIALTGLPADFFFDPYFLESATIRKRIFVDISSRGFTRKRRLINLLFDTYNTLNAAVQHYSDNLARLSEEHETIKEEIKLFYRNNDIDSIMTFIRRLEAPGGDMNGMLHGGQTVQINQRLSSKLRLQPPLAAEELLPTLPLLPALKTIKPQLSQMAEAAYAASPDLDVRDFCVPAD